MVKKFLPIHFIYVGCPENKDINAINFLAHWGLLRHGQKKILPMHFIHVRCPESKDINAIKIFKTFILKNRVKKLDAYL